jgi:DNA-binding transcriptional LysR family regulator
MRFKGLDLNLLVALDVLLRERNVSRAAERLNISQSALSGALGRLRQHFGDEILVPSGRQLVPTALSETLQLPLRDAILQIETVVSTDGKFNPPTSRRHFKVEIPDYSIPVLLPKVTQHVAVEAPHVVLELRLPSGDPAPLLHKGELDLVITPTIYSNHRYICEPLWEDTHVLIGWSGNAALASQPDLAVFLSLQQVVVRIDRARLANTLSEDQLAIFGGDGRIALVAPNFSSIPASLVGTTRVAILHGRLAQVSSQSYPLAIWASPIELPKFSDVMMFHPARSQDAGLMWLREKFRAAVAEIDGA